MTDSPEDWETGCGCIECQSPHPEDGCPNRGVWWIAIHLVDNCSLVEGGAVRSVVCESCFTALVASADSIISWGLLGVRYPLCGSCHKPILRLSDIVEDIARL